MIKVHILTKGFASPNGRAFLFPLHVHRRRLLDHGIAFRCFSTRDGDLADCDVLAVDSRFYSKRWTQDEDAALGELDDMRKAVGNLLWFDISDSTGWLQSQVLTVVTHYCKSQLLKDRRGYLQCHYGNRLYADYYYRTCSVEDAEPVWSRPVSSAGLLDKLRVSWNSGLADYSRWGPLRMAMREKLPLDSLLRFPDRFTSPSASRTIPFACRFGISYSRETVAYQRRMIAEQLGRLAPTGKLSRAGYLAEMRNARVVVSPFGFGEITLKDFEALLCGSALLKPDMSHLETWPNLFGGGATMFTHRWDLRDLEQALNAALDDDVRRQEIAQNAQARYGFHIADEEGHNAFCERFRSLLEEAMAA